MARKPPDNQRSATSDPQILAAETSPTEPMAASATAGVVHNPVIQTTGPAFIRRHNISDEELEMLKQGNRDGLSEAFWAFIAGALAAAPSAMEAFYKAFVTVPSEAISPLHLLEIIIFSSCIVLAIATHFVRHIRGKTVSTLVDQIRARGGAA